MASQLPTYATKELSKKTWLDFEELFSQRNGWDHCRCMYFHRPHGLPKDEWLPTRAEKAERNRREKRQLIDTGHSHGILVYATEIP